MSEVVDVIALENHVRKFFNVEEFSLQFGVPTFLISNSPNLKQSFKDFYDSIKDLNLIPLLRKQEGKIVLKIFRIQERKGKSRISIMLLTFFATLLTILYSGFLQVTSISFDVIDPNRNIVLNIALYVLCLLSIAGLHEFGHKIASKFHGVETSFPYFIPGPPEIGGTMGAIIVQRSPTVNRDQLFDIGFSGPLLGFIAAVIVSILGIRLSYIVPKHSVYGVYLPVPFAFDLLIQILRPFNTLYYDFLLHPVAFAGWIGFLITFINLMPVAQLDGGHISRAIFGEKYHRFVSYIGIAFLSFSGYVLMALLAFILQLYRAHPGPLDDVSPLSFKRKIIGATIAPIIIMLSFTYFY
ncbi:MAG: site-2 protease family protein [Candidatus Methanomethylicia archaeon]|nr:site-2 protease family protein [Candidatus Methanomethylicia archaeon]MDW7988525.1 site-2 protease family protein [Nitrososphaerota archaeon]